LSILTTTLSYGQISAARQMEVISSIRDRPLSDGRSAREILEEMMIKLEELEDR